MPYNTRRKSLSLPALGIQLPSSSRANRPAPSKPSPSTETNPPPAKKIKRQHTTGVPSPTSPARPRSSTASSASKSVTFAERPKSSGRNTYENTPPPSPGAVNDAKVDTEGINDDIVTGVIEQLEKTGNRPHLIKELAAVLSTTSNAVSSSANPAALLSSRLAAYLKRPGWTVASPCPLGKELIPVHPRKVYFFLTTRKRQELPADSSGILSSSLTNLIGGGGKGGKRIISPSLSNPSIDEDADSNDERRREAMSPSPEVDLSAPELDVLPSGIDDELIPPTPAGSSFSGRSSLARDGSAGSSSEPINLAHNHRGASPPLEGDEREFTQTASSMRMRGLSMDDTNIRQSRETENMASEDSAMMQAEETEEERAKRNSEAAATLFGDRTQRRRQGAFNLTSSPFDGLMMSALGKRIELVEMGDTVSTFGDRSHGSPWEIQKPENVNLDELDHLFDEY